MTKQLTNKKMEMELRVLLLFSCRQSKEKHLDLLIKCTSNIKNSCLSLPLPIILSKTGKGQNDVSNPCIGAWDEVYVCVIQSWRGLQKQTSKGLLRFSTSKREEWILIQRSVNIIKVLLISQCCIQVSFWVNLGYEGTKMLMRVANLCLLSLFSYLHVVSG